MEKREPSCTVGGNVDTAAAENGMEKKNQTNKQTKKPRT